MGKRISITGDAASGKTELAYYLCLNHGYSFFSIGQLYLDLLEFCKDEIIFNNKLISGYEKIVDDMITNNKFELSFKLEHLNNSISIRKLKLFNSNKSVTGDKGANNLSILYYWVNHDMITKRINDFILNFLESDSSKLIIDGRMGFLFSTINIFLTADFETRVKRLMKSKNYSLRESYNILVETDKRDEKMNHQAKNSVNTHVIDTAKLDLTDLYTLIEDILK